MTADPTTTLAVAIAHELTDNAEVAEAIHEGRAPDVTDLAAHLLAVLAEEGWAVVKLREGKSADEAHRDVWGYFGEPGTYCGLGVCALGAGHHGACRC